eukprot:7894086-Alexandrium_andersonii.AAC.1
MSASLVGSEMCIRDSPTPHGQNGVEALARGPCRAGPRGRRSARKQGESCLLYTSDAADDM